MKKRADGRYLKQIRINGKVKSFYGKTIAEVNRKIMEYEGEQQSGRKFSVVADEWLAEYLNEVPWTTYKKCGQAAYNYALEWFGDTSIKDITAHDVSVYLKTLAAKGYYQKTVATYKSTLNQICNHALISGEIKVNPCSNVPLPRNLPKGQREIPNTDILKVVDTMHTGFGFFAYFLLYSGLRKSEALALNYEDIDRENMRIHVNKRIVYEGNSPVVQMGNKTESGTRDVILLDRLAEHLPNKKHGHIFGNDDGSYLTQKQVRCRWEKLQKDNNIKLTAHQLRHAYATMLFEANIDIKDAQELMGHSDINLTRQIYTHIRNERKEETAKKLNAFSF